MNYTGTALFFVCVLSHMTALLSMQYVIAKTEVKGVPWWPNGWDCTPNVGGAGSIPGWGTKISHLSGEVKEKKTLTNW